MPTMPSGVSSDRSRFDKFASAVTRQVSRSWFFSLCVALIVAWAPSYPLWGNGDTYQLVVNTGTTIITFLLVALLQNATQRADQATQHKLNAVAAAQAETMLAEERRAESPADRARLVKARRELVAAVGLEERESA